MNYYEGEIIMKNLLSKHLFNRPYSELPLASEIYVDRLSAKLNSALQQ